jgi:uncharacterized protein (DUF433 family)
MAGRRKYLATLFPHYVDRALAERRGDVSRKSDWAISSRSRPATFDVRKSEEDTTRMKLDRIQVAPGVCEGRPTIRGLRITVEFVLQLLADGYAADDIVREYPELEKEDVYQAARFGAWLAGQRTSAVA